MWLAHCKIVPILILHWILLLLILYCMLLTPRESYFCCFTMYVACTLQERSSIVSKMHMAPQCEILALLILHYTLLADCKILRLLFLHYIWLVPCRIILLLFFHCMWLARSIWSKWHISQKGREGLTKSIRKRIRVQWRQKCVQKTFVNYHALISLDYYILGALKI